MHSAHRWRGESCRIHVCQVPSPQPCVFALALPFPWGPTLLLPPPRLQAKVEGDPLTRVLGRRVEKGGAPAALCSHLLLPPSLPSALRKGCQTPMRSPQGRARSKSHPVCLWAGLYLSIPASSLQAGTGIPLLAGQKGKLGSGGTSRPPRVQT